MRAPEIIIDDIYVIRLIIFCQISMPIPHVGRFIEVPYEEPGYHEYGQ
jgi:hypothetical protein